MTLDKHLWAERDHVTVGELCEWFPRYLYLPRVKGRETLLEAVRDGASLTTVDDVFATAERYDESSSRYLGLRVGTMTHGVLTAIDNHTMLGQSPSGSSPVGRGRQDHGR